MFHDCSFGFRPKRTKQQAAERALSFHEQGDDIALVPAISGFFDNIPHKSIMEPIADEIADGNILNILKRFLSTGVLVGGPLNQLLANIVLNKLDQQLEEHGFRFVRFATDFVVVCGTREQADTALLKVESVLSEIGLALTNTKARYESFAAGYEFLGKRLSLESQGQDTRRPETE